MKKGVRAKALAPLDSRAWLARYAYGSPIGTMNLARVRLAFLAHDERNTSHSGDDELHNAVKVLRLAIADQRTERPLPDRIDHRSLQHAGHLGESGAG